MANEDFTPIKEITPEELLAEYAEEDSERVQNEVEGE
jgi:hypothetical protein